MRFARSAAAAIIWLGTANRAFAHSSIEGLNDFYNGVLHPAFVPAHGLALLCAGLLLGQQRPEHIERILGVFLGALGTALVLAGLGFERDLEIVLLAATAALGVLVALAQRLPFYGFAALAIVVGAAVGLGSAPESSTAAAKAVALLGTCLGALLLLIYGIALTGFVRARAWQPIAIRVLGSWAAAAALLALSLVVFGAGPAATA